LGVTQLRPNSFFPKEVTSETYNGHAWQAQPRAAGSFHSLKWVALRLSRYYLLSFSTLPWRNPYFTDPPSLLLGPPPVKCTYSTAILPNFRIASLSPSDFLFQNTFVFIISWSPTVTWTK
jgi:hypothetical protein